MKARGTAERGSSSGWPGANQELSRHVWATRYRHPPTDATLTDTWRRVARAVAEVEPPESRSLWEERFFSELAGLRLLPGGRILAGAGTGRKVTLFNCFVMGTIEDSLEGIFDALEEGALTMQQGGGVGYDFSTLRPCGFPARTAGTIASGPVSFMRIWDAMCATLLSTGGRRGAMMATLRADHPDIEAFVEAKASPGELAHFNLSVQVPEELVEAVAADAEWPLVFPASAFGGAGEGVEDVLRWWPGEEGPVPCRVVRVVRARDLWRRIVEGAYERGEPGVLFVDRINRWNNLWYRERITATNPCGEAPLPREIFRTTEDLSPGAHVEMQAMLQPLVDGAISKTVNVPRDLDLDLDAFGDLYRLADERGLKGLTLFRPGPTQPGILKARTPTGTADAPCCDRERPLEEEAGMTRNFVRSNDSWDLEQQENDLIMAGYRQVDWADLKPGEFRRVAELDELEHQPVVTLEWEDGIEA